MDAAWCMGTSDIVNDQNYGRLPKTGYIRLATVLALIPVSKSTWWKGVAEGRFPKPTKRFGPRIAAWDVNDIRELVESEE